MVDATQLVVGEYGLSGRLRTSGHNLAMSWSEKPSMTQPRYSHEMQPGDMYEPLRFIVTPELNQQFLYALECFHRRYIEARDDRPPLVHPVVLLHHTPRTRSPSYRLAPRMGSVFARDNTRFLGPAYVGRWLLVSWRIDACYEKKGRLFQDYSAHLTDEAGTLLLDRAVTSVFRSGAPQ